MAKELRQTINTVKIAGTLKENNLEEFTLNDGREALRGNVVIEVKEEDKIHNHRIEVFTMKHRADGELSGLYKGYKTVLDEYKDAARHGEDADRIIATAEVGVNEYMSRDGNFISNNNIEGLFFSRLTEPTKDFANADLEMIIDSIEPELDSEGLPSGDFEMNGKAVGFFHKKKGRNMIVPIKGIKIKQGLYEQIKNFYLPGETVRITCKLNNYAEVKKQESTETTFGEVVDYDIATNYVREIRMVGGRMPVQDETKFTPQDIELMEKYREEEVNDVKGAFSKSNIPEFAETPDTADLDFTDPNEVPDF